MALMSNYAFSKLKLKRIDCAFTFVQKSWQQRTELLGYKHFFRSRYRAKTYSSTWCSTISSMADFEMNDIRKEWTLSKDGTLVILPLNSEKIEITKIN